MTKENNEIINNGDQIIRKSNCFKKNLIITSCLLLLSIIYTLIVKYVDVSAIGPEGSFVGLSTINQIGLNIFKYNETMYKITDVLGYVPFLFALIYAIRGFIELIKTKSLLKVDKKIYMAVIFYILMLAVFVFFEKVVINCRPVIIDGVLEASYPSSHTLFAICMCISTIMLNTRMFKKSHSITILNIIAMLLLITIIAGRVIAGVHWISDILGGIIIGSTLCMVLKTMLSSFKN